MKTVPYFEFPRGKKRSLLLSTLAAVSLIGVAASRTWEPLGVLGFSLVPLVGLALIDVLNGLGKGDGIGPWESLTLSTGVGLALTAITITILRLTELAYSPLATGVILACIIWSATLMRYILGFAHDSDGIERSEGGHRRRTLGGIERFDRLAGIAMVLVLIGSIGTMGAIQRGYEEDVGLTLLYLTDGEGGFMGLPQRFTVREPCSFNINIEARDGVAKDYRIMVMIRRNLPENLEREAPSEQRVDSLDGLGSISNDAIFVTEVHLKPDEKVMLPLSCSFTLNGSYSLDIHLVGPFESGPFRNLKLQIFVDAVNLLPSDFKNDWEFPLYDAVETNLSPHEHFNQRYSPGFLVNITNERADVLTVARLKDPVEIDPFRKYEIFGWNMSDNCTGELAIEVFEEDGNGSIIERHILQPLPLPVGHRSFNWTRSSMFLSPDPATMFLDIEITVTKMAEVLNGTVLLGKLNLVDTEEVFYLESAS